MTGFEIGVLAVFGMVLLAGLYLAIFKTEIIQFFGYAMVVVSLFWGVIIFVITHFISKYW